MFKQVKLLFWILLRSLRMRPLANTLAIGAIILAVGLALVVPLSLDAFQKGSVNAARIFDLLVTAEGSQSQAVLNTIYYQDVPLGNIPYRVFEALKNDARTVRAVPLGFGDNFQNHPIVGTHTSYFELRAKPSDPPYYQLAQGRLFLTEEEAVIGAQVAKASGLSLGATFSPAHGFQGSFDPSTHVHDYTVTGILEATGGPSDKAIYVDIVSVWESHGQYHIEETPAQEAWTLESLNEPLSEDHLDTRGITAILWAPHKLNDVYSVANYLNNTVDDVQAIFPGRVLGRLSASLGQGRKTYGLLANLVLLLAVITVALNTYSSALQTQKDLAILRAIGIPRSIVASSVVLEAALLSLIGIALGLAAAYLGTLIVANTIAAQTSITLPLPQLTSTDWLKASLLLPVAILFALLPALNAARKSPLAQL